MSWRPHGRASVRPSDPRAFAVCDRCGMWYNHENLTWQYQFAGPNLQNLRLLVCRKCLDIPQPQLKPRILPPDPVPIMNARPEFFTIDETDWIGTQAGGFLGPQGGGLFVSQNEANQMLPSTPPP